MKSDASSTALVPTSGGELVTHQFATSVSVGAADIVAIGLADHEDEVRQAISDANAMRASLTEQRSAAEKAAHKARSEFETKIVREAEADLRARLLSAGLSLVDADGSADRLFSADKSRVSIVVSFSRCGRSGGSAYYSLLATINISGKQDTGKAGRAGKACIEHGHLHLQLPPCEPSPEIVEAEALADRIQSDLNAVQNVLVDLRAQVSEVELARVSRRLQAAMARNQLKKAGANGPDLLDAVARIGESSKQIIGERMAGLRARLAAAPTTATSGVKKGRKRNSKS